MSLNLNFTSSPLFESLSMTILLCCKKQKQNQNKIKQHQVDNSTECDEYEATECREERRGREDMPYINSGKFCYF